MRLVNVTSHAVTGNTLRTQRGPGWVPTRVHEDPAQSDLMARAAGRVRWPLRQDHGLQPYAADAPPHPHGQERQRALRGEGKEECVAAASPLWAASQSRCAAAEMSCRWKTRPASASRTVLHVNCAYFPLSGLLRPQNTLCRKFKEGVAVRPWNGRAHCRICLPIH